MEHEVLVDWLRGSDPAARAPGRPPARRRGRRAPWLLALAGGLWLGVTAVAWQWLSPTDPGDEPAPTASEPAVLSQAVGAHAVLAVREAVSHSDGPRRRYVDLAVAETVDWFGEVAIVEVLAHLLEGDEAAWTSERVARFAVAVGAPDGRPVVWSRPWPLGSNAVGAAGPSWSPVAEPDLVPAAHRALTAAGYAGITEIELAASAGLPGVLRAMTTATAPGERAPDRHEVWLDDRAATVLGQGGAR
jgi:hypothetical protein